MVEFNFWLSVVRMYCEFIHFSFSISKVDGAFDIWLSSNFSVNSLRDIIVVLSSNDHPRRDKEFNIASGRKPSSLYASIEVAPWRLLNRDLSDPKIIGKCTYVGGFHPKLSYISKCFGYPVFNADKEVIKVYKNEKDANDYMAAIMIAKGGG